ncbi:membrane protein [Vespertiliibacter pulmonis]|uniref:Membrane protein n=1 Tax=Vespertiliibacter pulmonis TaxID=1443036 RepID=A0A3N4VCQ7_9PAST|nr:YtjB family periplasmic protein [Vespertiliibacter pulmonis]RPE80802.1 membrane protein [Vespertiliibacter pulmonis]
MVTTEIMQKISRKMWKMGILASVMITCLLTVSLIITSINHFKIGSQLAGINQVANLSHLLVRQQAKLFSLMLIRNAKTEELAEALDTFSKEEFVIDATLYAPTGILIAQSHNTLKFTPTSQDMSNKQTQQIVEPILSQQNLVGFLRVTFDSQYGQTTQSKVNDLFHLLYGELIILFLTGGLFISCFYYFTHKRVHIIHTPLKLAQAENKSQTQRFHSRRRAFGRK